MLTVGDKLPEFKVQAVVSPEPGKEFEEVTHASHPGKWRVLFFWPMDFTFVCPTEIAEFGRMNEEFAEARRAGARREHRHALRAPRVAELASRRSKDLPFPMLADTKRELSTALGILHKTEGVAAAGDVHRRPGGRHPLGERQRSQRRPQRPRGAPRARRAPDRRAVSLQLAAGPAHAGGGLTGGVPADLTRPPRGRPTACRGPTRGRTARR